MKPNITLNRKLVLALVVFIVGVGILLYDSLILLGTLRSLAVLISAVFVLILGLLAGYKVWLKPSLEFLNMQHLSILTTMAEGVVIQDSNGIIVFHNSAACKILGISSNQLLGKQKLDPNWEAINEDLSRYNLREHPAFKTLQTGQAFRNVIMGIKLPDNSKRWIKLSSLPYFSPAATDNKMGVVCTFSDISELKQNQIETDLAIRRLNIATQAVGFGVWDWNLKTGTLVWDESMYKVFGLEKSEFDGTFSAFENLLVPEDAKVVQAELMELFETKRTDYVTQFRIQKKIGDIRYIAGAAKAFYDQNGEIERLVGMNWDVTEENRLREESSSQQRMLTAQEKMASLGAMASGIAHEINNPLAIIIGRAEQLQKSIASENIDVIRSQKYLNSIISTCHRIAKIISGLKTFSRNAESDPMVKESFGKILEDTLALCQEKFEKNAIQILTEAPGEVILRCRPTQVSQVLLNLLGNSIDAISGKKEKWIRVQVKDDASGFYVVSVIDSGLGIPSQIIDKVMQPFFTTKSVGKGTGLGLSISKGIVEDHGGRIEIDLNSKNTKFDLYFPKVLV